jgi:hypothetical protein
MEQRGSPEQYPLGNGQRAGILAANVAVTRLAMTGGDRVDGRLALIGVVRTACGAYDRVADG